MGVRLQDPANGDTLTPSIRQLGITRKLGISPVQKKALNLSKGMYLPTLEATRIHYLT